MTVSINCDMGEGFGLYRMGDDAGIMPFITIANVACGFHASDPNHMRRTARLAGEHGVAVGAHPSLPDLQGFGRREMTIPRQELANLLIYQIGALAGILEAEGMALNHVKAHGALYGMAQRDRDSAEAIADAAAVFGVPVLGMAGTLHEEVIAERGLVFVAEYFADLPYDEDGRLIILREHDPVDPEDAARRALDAVEKGTAPAITGKEIRVRADSICVHSDTPNAIAIAQAVRAALGSHLG